MAVKGKAQAPRRSDLLLARLRALQAAVARADVIERLESRTLLSTGAGALDASFNSTGTTPGVVQTAISGSGDQATALAVQTDNRLVVAGDSTGNGTIELARYNADGSLDTTFGSGGLVTTSVAGAILQANAVTLNSAGDIFVAGTVSINGSSTGPDIAVADYSPAGILVAGFGAGGIASIDFNNLADAGTAITIDPSSGNVVVAGTGTTGGGGGRKELAIATLDSRTGNVIQSTLTPIGAAGDDQAESVAVQMVDGSAEYVIGGTAPVDGASRFTLARYSASLTLDSSFGNAGVVTTSLGSGGDETSSSIVIGGNGDIYAAGAADDSAALAVYTTNGSLITSFIAPATTGFAAANGLAIQYNGKIVLTGYNDSGAAKSMEVARIDQSGTSFSPDPAFGTGGYAATAYTVSGNAVDAEANAVELDATGKIAVAGESSGQFTVARYVSNNAPTGSGSASLDPINQFEMNSPGNTVVSLVAQLSAADADGDSVGIAITAVDDSHGTWEYSTASGTGTSWNAINAAVSDSNAFVLMDSAANLIRFVPNSVNGASACSPSLTLRLWDQTQGYANATLVNVSANSGGGGSNLNSFSDASFTATMNVAAPTEVFVDQTWLDAAAHSPAADLQGESVTDGTHTATFGVDAFSAIQDGIDSVPASGTVHIDSGTYTGQISITQNLTLIGQSESGVIIQPGTSLVSQFTDSVANYSTVFVGNHATAGIETLTIDSPTAGGANGSLEGIALLDAAGTVDHVTVNGSNQSTGVLIEGAGATVWATNNTIGGSSIGAEFTMGGGGSISGTTFGGSANQTDLLINSTAGLTAIGDGNAFGAAGCFIDDLSSQSFDLSNDLENSFGAFNAAVTTVTAGTLPSFYSVEAKISDVIDGGGSGLIRLNHAGLFVTQTAEQAQSGAIARAESAASLSDTIYVQGTLTFNPATPVRSTYGSPATVSGTVSSDYSLDGDSATITVNASAGATATAVISSNGFGPAILQTQALNAGTCSLTYGLADTRVLFDATIGNSGTLVIGKAALTISAVTDSKVYDGTAASTQTPSFQVAGEPVNTLYGSDTLTGLSESFGSKNVLGSGLSLLRLNGYSVNDGNGGNNYTVTLETASGTITPRALTITAAADSKPYDGNTTATVRLSDNRVAGDVFTDSDATANFNTSSVGTSKPVAVTGISISGADAGNYTFNTTAAATASILARTVVVIGSSFTVAEGSPYTGPVATFTDANGLEPAGVYNAIINWGDGSAATAGAITINGSTATVSGNHVYASGPAGYPVSVVVTDGAGGANNSDAASPATATVTEVPPTLTLSGSATVNEGSPYILTLSASDPGTHILSTSWLINWGDGETSTVAAGTFTFNSQTGLYSSAVTASHIYVTSASFAQGNSAANYTISASATDSAGGYSAGNTVAVAVAYIAPVVPLSDSVSNQPLEGSIYSLNLGQLIAPGGSGDASHPAVSTIEYIVNWGDGATTTLSGSTLQHAVSAGGTLTHTYELPYSFMITLDVLDSNGYHSASQSGGTVTSGGILNIVVQSVAPTASFAGSSSLLQGSNGSVTFYNQNSASTVAMAAGFTYQIDLVDSTHTLVIKPISIIGQSAGNGSYPVTISIPTSALSLGQNIIRGRIIDEFGAVSSYYQTINVTAASFQVTSLTPTSTGFDVTFNDPANISKLHIYGSTGGFGNVPDVTLIGNTTGVVEGSLVWDSSTNTAHFVKTGGPLLPDTYKVTLVSGANGWVNTAGAALDGTDTNGNKNYTGTFVVAYSTSEPTLTLPYFARGPGQAVNVPSTGAGLPIQLVNAAGVYSVDFHLIYNTNLLTISAATLGSSLPSGWTLTSNFFAGPGQINFTAWGPTAISTNALFNLVSLSASVPTYFATYGASADIQIQNLVINGGNTPSLAGSAVEKVAYFGDTDGDASITPNDASLISRVIVGIDSGFNAYALTDPVIIGNVSGTGTLSGLDAAYVFQSYLGYYPGAAYVPVIPAVAGITTGGPDPAISVPGDVLATRGGSVTVPVSISDLTNVLGAAFTLNYDPSVLTISGTSLVSLSNSNWTIGFNPANGRVGLYESNPTLMGLTGPGTLADLTVSVAASANPGVVQLQVSGPTNVGSGGGALTYAYGSGSIDVPPDFTGNHYAVRLDGSGNVDVWENVTESGTPTYMFPVLLYGNPNFQQLTFNTTASGGLVTIDATNGNPLPAGGIAFNANGVSNTLNIVGGSGVNSVTVGSTGYAFDGDPLALNDVLNFNFNAGAGINTLTQSGQPAVNITFNYGGGTDDLTVNGGVFTFAANAAGAGMTAEVIDSISIASGAKVVFAPAASLADRHVVELNNLSIAGSMSAWRGSLDLTSNDLIVHNGNLPQLSNQLASGFNAGGAYWSGTGITSSAAAGDPSFLTALGAELNNDGNGHALFGSGAPLGAFDGQSPALSDVLIKYTFYGDANFDGKVDGSDYSRIDGGSATRLTGWSNGDFNFDGRVDGSDYTLIDNAFNSQGVSMASVLTAANCSTPADIVTKSKGRPGAIAVNGFAWPTVFAADTAQLKNHVEASLWKADLLDGLSGGD